MRTQITQKCCSLADKVELRLEVENVKFDNKKWLKRGLISFGSCRTFKNSYGGFYGEQKNFQDENVVKKKNNTKCF